MSDKKTEKKFANMHYPGMKSDPNEAKHGDGATLPEQFRSQFASQIAAFGEEGLNAIYGTAVLVLGADARATCVVKCLAALGVGRVGVFGDEQIADESTLSALSKWFKIEAPWCSFEPFRDVSIDRRFDDVLRGFDYVVAATISDPQTSLMVAPRDHYCAQCMMASSAGSAPESVLGVQAARVTQNLVAFVLRQTPPIECPHKS